VFLILKNPKPNQNKVWKILHYFSVSVLKT